MNDDKKVTNQDNSVINNDERRGLNESVKYENADNNYQNNEPVQDKGDGKDKTSEVDEDIKALEGGSQKNPGSSGAFPVGAFDTSKD